MKAQYAKDLDAYNYERSERLNLMADVWENGQYLADGTTYKPGMEGWTNDDVVAKMREGWARKRRRWTDIDNPVARYANGDYDQEEGVGEEDGEDFGISAAMGLDVDDEPAEDETLEDTASRLKYEQRPELELELDEEGRIVGPDPLRDEDLEVDWFAVQEGEEMEGVEGETGDGGDVK